MRHEKHEDNKVASTASTDNVPISLVIMVFIPPENKERLDIFMYALRSYKAMHIQWKHVYLFIKLAPEMEERKHELLSTIEDVFKDFPVSLQFDRPMTKHGYKELVHNLCGGFPVMQGEASKLGCRDPDHLVMFLQNDDHVFVDFDNRVLLEGLRQLHKDTYPHRALYLSHWPEILLLAGKYENFRTAGSDYIVFSSTVSDAVQVMNAGHLHFLLHILKWPKEAEETGIRRIDELMVEYSSGDPRSMEGRPEIMNSDFYRKENIYAPLRELMRHYHGYDHSLMNPSDCPALNWRVPPTNYTLHQKPSELVRKMTSAGKETAWSSGNKFVIPGSWIMRNLQLHGY